MRGLRLINLPESRGPKRTQTARSPVDDAASTRAKVQSQKAITAYFASKQLLSFACV